MLNLSHEFRFKHVFFGLYFPLKNKNPKKSKKQKSKKQSTLTNFLCIIMTINSGQGDNYEFSSVLF